MSQRRSDRHDPEQFEAARTRMMKLFLSRRLVDNRVLGAIASVRRERFVPDDLVEFAYEDRPLCIGAGQTISQPFIVAVMAESAEIEPSDRVLEIGTGSGYGAAVLARLGAEVWTIERHRSLADEAAERLSREGFDNVHVMAGDGTLGWPEEAPFDVIVVTAAGPEIPTALCEQLAENGRLIMPMGPDDRHQSLLRVRRHGQTFSTEDLAAVRFVPLIGAQAWDKSGRAKSTTPRRWGRWGQS